MLSPKLSSLSLPLPAPGLPVRGWTAVALARGVSRTLGSQMAHSPACLSAMSKMAFGLSGSLSST
eukprot:5572325-Pyramimonas_sp.AAC.1